MLLTILIYVCVFMCGIFVQRIIYEFRNGNFSAKIPDDVPEVKDVVERQDLTVVDSKVEQEKTDEN